MVCCDVDANSPCSAAKTKPAGPLGVLRIQAVVVVDEVGRGNGIDDTLLVGARGN